MASYGSLPFAEQIAFFKQKVDLPTERWDDLLGAAHDRAFVVAGATKADLLADLHAAVLKGIEQGTTLADFRRDFDALVAKHGWTGWTGQGTPGGEAWRTRIIYETNLRTSYAAGRWAQIQEGKAERPYLEYRHSDSALNPRPEHVAWDGKVIPVDDPWWQTHYPPNGWGCKCRAFALSDTDLERLGKRRPDPRPTDPADTTGIDRGWDYAPGQDAWQQQMRAKAERLPERVAQDFRRDLDTVTPADAQTALRPPDLPVAEPVAAARADCLAFGQQTKRERLIALNEATGEELDRADGTPHGVVLTDRMKGLIADPQQAVRMIHNHPRGTSLSGDDVRLAREPGVAAVEAVGHNGDRFSATVSSAVPALDLAQAIDQAYRAIDTALFAARIDGRITYEVSDHLQRHLANAAIAQTGLIDYQAHLTPATVGLLETYRAEVQAAIAAALLALQQETP